MSLARNCGALLVLTALLCPFNLGFGLGGSGEAVAAGAKATDLFPGTGLVELLPAGDILGDGHTQVTFYMIALEPDGTPTTGLLAKVTPTFGLCGDVQEVEPGMYRFSFTPPQLTIAKKVDLNLKGKTLKRGNLYRAFTINVLPPPSHRLAATLNPAVLVLGQDTTASLTIQLSDKDVDPASLDILTAPSAGTVSDMTFLGEGKYTARYTPPVENVPQMLVLNVADRNDPSRSFSYVAAPLFSATNWETKLDPRKNKNARVVLRVGDREFGPVAADPKGKVVLPIIVPPGVDHATAIVTTDNAPPRTDAVDLKIPPTRRISFLPVQAGIPMDSALRIPLRFSVVTASGAAATEARVTLTSTAGTVTMPVHEGNGIFKADFTPPSTPPPPPVPPKGSVRSAPKPSATKPGTPVVPAPIVASLVASIEGESETQFDKLDLTLVPARPLELVLSAEPTVIPGGPSEFTVKTHLVDIDGQGVTGRSFKLQATGARPTVPLADVGAGDYTATFQTLGPGPVELSAALDGPASGNTMRRIVLIPNSDHILNDGLSSDMITIVATDEFGYSVANVPISLKVLSGDGSLPATATTGPGGVVQVYYTSGRKTGLVRIEASSGIHTAGFSFMQGPATLVGKLAFPRSGTDQDSRLLSAWTPLVRTLRVERGPAPPPPPAPVVAPAPAPPPEPARPPEPIIEIP
jgi:hypothetical protein